MKEHHNEADIPPAETVRPDIKVLQELVEMACRFNCDADDTPCQCRAHELYCNLAAALAKPDAGEGTAGPDALSAEELTHLASLCQGVVGRNKHTQEPWVDDYSELAAKCRALAERSER